MTHNNLATVLKELGLISNKYKQLFRASTPPNFVQQRSQKAAFLSLEIREALVKDDIGYIQALIDYEVDGNGIKNVKYSFKFFSSVDKVMIFTPEKSVTKRYGFRFEKDLEHEGWGHPEMHIQHEYSTRPRFSHINSDRAKSDEIWAFDELLRTVRETYCSEDSFAIEESSILMLQ